MFSEQLEKVKFILFRFFMCDQVIKSLKLDENYTKDGVKSYKNIA